MKILKNFFDILNRHISDQYYAKFRQNRRKKIFGHFWTIFGPLCSQKNFSPILTKFGVVIVRNMAIQNIKKNFQNFHFSDHFLTVCTNAQFNAKNFCCKIFCLQKNSIGANLKGIDMCVKKLVLSSKIENGGVAVLPPGGRDPQN